MSRSLPILWMILLLGAAGCTSRSQEAKWWTGRLWEGEVVILEVHLKAGEQIEFTVPEANAIRLGMWVRESDAMARVRDPESWKEEMVFLSQTEWQMRLGTTICANCLYDLQHGHHFVLKNHTKVASDVVIYSKMLDEEDYRLLEEGRERERIQDTPNQALQTTSMARRAFGKVPVCDRHRLGV